MSKASVFQGIQQTRTWLATVTVACFEHVASFLLYRLVTYHNRDVHLTFSTGILVLFWKKARQALQMNCFMVLLVATPWVVYIMPASLESGDVPRCSLPFQTLILILGVWWGRFWMNWKKNEILPA